MKKISWNTIVFLISLAVYLGYFLLFWNVFDDNALYWAYGPLCRKALFATPVVNALCQTAALFQKKRRAVMWILLGFIACFFTEAFTAGMGI